MANTKVTILNNIVTQLSGITGVHTVTRNLFTPVEARKRSPYLGVISNDEVVVTEDDTDILYRTNVDIIILVKTRLIEEWIDLVKQVVYNSSFAGTVGAKQIRLIGQREVALINADEWSSTRIILEMIYVSSKSGF